MSYAPLKGRDGYLKHFETLNTSRKALAESTADLMVDTYFQAWDRDLWHPGNVPAEVERFALLLGAAEYIMLEVAATNPTVEEPPLVRHLRELAEAISTESRARGWVLGQDRLPQYGREGRKSSINARLVR
jgi:hypothetical protein